MPGAQRNVLPLSLLIAIVLLGSLGGCKPQEEVRIRAIVGAVLIDGAGGPPISNSVILISGAKIRAAGARTNISIPQATEEIDGSGQYIIPAPVEIYARRGAEVYSLAGGQKLAAGTLAAGTTAEEARRQVDGFAAAHRAVVAIDSLETAAEEAALEQARKDSLPLFARVSKLADVERLVNEGAVGFIGMIADTGQIDAAFLAKMRDLRVTWAPALVEGRGTARIARRNSWRPREGDDGGGGRAMGAGNGGAGGGRTVAR